MQVLNTSMSFKFFSKPQYMILQQLLKRVTAIFRHIYSYCDIVITVKVFL
jgi:hypothetical protein